MKFTQRFEAARTEAQKLLEDGDYRWVPTTSIGWVIRIACTDVGQNAWVQVKPKDQQLNVRTIQPTQDAGAHSTSETD
jgi:hypothetical protein